MTLIDVPPAAVVAVHDFLAGGGDAVAALLEKTRSVRAHGPVLWRVPVTGQTVHHIESLHRLAEAEGVAVAFEPDPGLTERDRAFFDDHHRYRIENDKPAVMRRRAGELMAGLHEALDALLMSVTPTRKPTATVDSFRSVVIIGAYGGDHVGDAAILGGTIVWLHETYAVTQATVMSYRADHTRRLVSGLKLPISVAVEAYRPGCVARLLDDADALVMAGGPIVDLPRVLAKHLSSAHAARVRGKPFLVHRAGLGEFRHALSRRAARRTLDLARSISLRSTESASHHLAQGLKFSMGRDPAFDYLATRGTLDRMEPDERGSADTLLAGTADSLRVGINLRPVSNDWHPRGRRYAAALKERFLDHLADGLQHVTEAMGRPVTFVFFPMNAIQFGMSDLTAAYELHRRLRNRARLVVWEADPTVDGVLYVVRRLDAAVVMRMHAALFCLSQRIPVFGIDYAADGNGKLIQLFSDERRRGAVCGMEEFTAGWIEDRLGPELNCLVQARRVGCADR